MTQYHFCVIDAFGAINKAEGVFPIEEWQKLPVMCRSPPLTVL